MVKKNMKSEKKESGESGSSTVKVIGFGNIFMGDDGVGIRVIEKLKEDKDIRDKDGIELIDGGTSGVDLIFLLQGARQAIIVDAVDAGQKIGEIVEFELSGIKKIRKNKTSFKSFSLHDIDLHEVLELIKTLKLKINLKIFGIKPFKVGYSEKISPEIEGKIPELIIRIKKELTGKK